MDKDIAIKVENARPVDYAIQVNGVSKTFRIPHEKITTLRGAFVSALRSHSYEEFQALDDVSFEVKKGEFFGIIGRNGSGKSTLLKILAGIYQPDGGKVHVNGLISPFLELGIGFNPELSGRDNVYLNAAVLGLSKKQIDEKFDHIVEFSEIGRFIDQKIKNYSSGMQVRLAFSVAIHANREILLMDEVLAVGDANFQSKCLQEFSKYKDQGKTVILVTHDIATVQRYCDRAMLVRNGRIEMIGKSDEVGDEYIRQNMSDEEKRIFEEEKKQREKSEQKAEETTQKKSKVAEITKVEFLDKDGNTKNIFQPRDDISIRVYFKIFKKMDEFNFGLAIYNQQDDYIFGINTIFDKINVSDYMRDGYYQVNIKNIPLNKDSYYILANVVKDNFNLPYDLRKKMDFFKVMSSIRNEGINFLDYRWK